MTVIAWHGATRTLAADKQMTYNGYPVTVTKIFRRDDGWLVGGCGVSDTLTEMIEWFLNGSRTQDFPHSCRNEESNRLLTVSPDACVYLYCRTPYPIEIFEPHFAIGGGSEYAITAMYLGKNAVEAVDITNKLYTGCGIGVDDLTLDERQ